jgi:putative hydroxymethylpyrimidine transport system ATP-binding protein
MDGARTLPETCDRPPGIELAGARLDFSGRTLFDGLDFRLEAGLFTCLLGPSGVGKTSLLRLIARLQNSAEAVVSADDGRPLAGRVAYMAQQDLLMPWLSVLDNALVGPRLRGEVTAKIRMRALELLDLVGLSTVVKSRPAALSGGMRQRVALVRTIIEDRPIVLMDEPFSALDAITRVRLQDLAAGLLRGRTVLLVTHDPFEALRLGHRVQVMAGLPARLGPAIEPPGPPPRPTTDPKLLELQGELLARLAAADSTNDVTGVAGAAP